MVDQVKIPIVEELPNGEEPYPNTDGMPQGTVGHPGEHLEHQPITHNGKVIAAPEGYGQTIQTVPPPDEVEKMLREETGEGGRWFGEFLRRLIKKEEPSKAG